MEYTLMALHNAGPFLLQPTRQTQRKPFEAGRHSAQQKTEKLQQHRYRRKLGTGNRTYREYINEYSRSGRWQSAGDGPRFGQNRDRSIHGRHCHRVLRLLRIRHRRCELFPEGVLRRHHQSDRRAAGQPADLRHRVHRPSAGLVGVRPLRRPYGPQDHAGGLPAHHGHCHLPDRLPADLQPMGCRGRRRAVPMPLRAGHRTWRRMVRRRVGGHRERSGRQARAVRLLPGAGRPDRLLPVERHLLPAGDLQRQ